MSELDDVRLRSAVESMLLVSGGPASISAMANATGCSSTRVLHILKAMQTERTGGIRLQIVDGEAQLVTAPENVEIIQRFLGAVRPPSLSRPALETLAFIAYHQPVTRPEIEAARGVNSDRAVQTLLARGLVEERGTRETLGRPMQYGTGFGFLEFFGLTSLDDLPPLEVDREDRRDGSAIGLRSMERESP